MIEYKFNCPITLIKNVFVPIRCQLLDGGIDIAIKHNMPLMDGEQSIYSEIVKPGDNVWDVGSYIGTHAILFALCGASNVTCFEPSKLNFPRLLQNIEGWGQISAHKVALSNVDELVNIELDDCTSSTGKYETQEFQKVKTSSFLSNVEKPDFIKLDIEGAESVVLSELDLTYKPVISLETHPGSSSWVDVKNGGFDFNSLFSIYKVEEVENGEKFSVNEIKLDRPRWFVLS